MNLSLTKDEFHETIMLYLIDIAKKNKSQLKEDGTIVYSPEFDDFLRHIISKPLGNLKTTYYRQDTKTKLSFKRMSKNIEDRDEVRLII
ncbi:MAG: hypothetical protein KQ78_02247 [Candidatus Izimaplasma bacterium HR2]|nr:MAG: hypothetical protein KQ78_02247 [Candidatus Izimaplasma bacterium HR2]